MSNIIKSDRVKLEAGGPIRARRGPEEQHTKSTRLVSVDGEVRAIEFRCTCGELSLIELSYPEQPTRKQ